MTLPFFETAMPGYEQVKVSALRFVEATTLSGEPWLYRKEAGGSESFYGSFRALHVLDMFGGLDIGLRHPCITFTIATRKVRLC